MGFRMKTTINIDDTVMAELKREAARQGRTMSELVETALRLLLASQRKRGRIPALPKFRSGGALVDVADRDALYHAMEGRYSSPSTPMCWSTPPSRTRNFMPPAATGSSANGRDRMLGTPLGRYSIGFCA